MPWYIFIHPLWQLLVLYLGVKNLLQGFNRTKSWTFSTHKHSTRGFVFSILVIIGAVIGWQVNYSLPNPIHLNAHRLIAFVIMALIILVVVSGLIKRKRWFRLRWLQFLHPWFGFLAIGLMFAQLFIVITKIIGW